MARRALVRARVWWVMRWRSAADAWFSAGWNRLVYPLYWAYRERVLRRVFAGRAHPLHFRGLWIEEEDRYGYERTER